MLFGRAARLCVLLPLELRPVPHLVGRSNSPVVTIFSGGLKDGRESSAKGVEAYLPQLLCLRLRWSSATASSDACVARTVVMSGIEKPIGEVADLSGDQPTDARPCAKSPEKVQFWAAGRTRFPALAIPSENGSLQVSDMACT